MLDQPGEEWFEEAVTRVLRHEGGYVNHPADPGGATKYGITQRTFDRWRAGLKRVSEDVKWLTLPEAKDIYRAFYWAAGGCHLLPWPLAYVHFDACVNHGIGRATRFLTESRHRAATYLTLREAFYRAIVARRPSQQVFLRGWFNRLRDVQEVVDAAERL